MKKAVMMGWSTMLVLIVVILTGVVLLSFLSNSGRISASASDKERCVSSVRSQALTKVLSPSTEVSLQCTTRYVDVKDADPIAQKKAIATEMVNCWEQFDQGRTKLFQVESGAYCVICSRLTFANPRQLDRFTQFLMETPIPLKAKTYYSYLFNVEGTPQIVSEYRNSAIADQDTLDTSKPLAVLFVAEKNVDKWAGYVATAGGTVVGAGAVVLSGGSALPIVLGGAGLGTTAYYIIAPHLVSEEFNAAVMLWPYDELARIRCNRLEGRAGPLEFVT